jgi:triphosphatase
METELKLLIAPADVAVFRRLALLRELAVAKPVTHVQRTTYFDTPQLRLKEHQMELRVRRIGRVFIQTLKADGQAAAGLHQRQEWEVRPPSGQPQVEPLIALVGANSTWAKVLGSCQSLAPIFNSEVRRTVWHLRWAQETEVELVLDQGELRQGDQHTPISEVELELKSGSAGALFDLALRLQQEIPLRIGNISKAARGHALMAPVANAVAKAHPVVLNRNVSVEAGFQVIVGNCLAQMQGNEASVMHGSTPEGIHQMRVGLRRLRSALRLFAAWISLPPTLQLELAWLGNELGAARDADVLADSTLPKVIEACPQETDLLLLRQTASVLADRLRQQAAQAVASVRYSRLMLGLVGWLQTMRWQASLDDTALAALAEPLAKHTARILQRRHQKLMRSGKRLAQGTPHEHHQLRIAAKKARYATEFFQSFYPAGRAKPYLKRLAALQDALGWLNDAAVADLLLRELQNSHPDLAGVACFTRGCLCAATRQDRLALLKLWKRLHSVEPPWARPR